MQWASLDSFFVQDAFWQDKMGKPIANRDFLLALLNHGTFDAYRFYYLDQADRDATRNALANLLSHEALQRLSFETQSALPDDIAKNPPDVFHQGDFTFHAPYLGEYRQTLAPERRFAISGITHSMDAVNIHGRLLQILLSGPKSYDAIVCTSRSGRRVLSAAFSHIRARFQARFGAELPKPPRLIEIPLGLSSEFTERPARGACRAALAISPDALVMLSLGRFSVRRKADLSPFLEAFEFMLRNKTLPENVLLILAGSGAPEDIALVESIVGHLGITENVRIETNFDLARKRQLYGASDFFVSLADNHQETFGLTLIEAMAHGLPVIASDFDGYRDIIAEGETGFGIPTYGSAESEPWQSLAGLLDPSMLGFLRSQKIAVDLTKLTDALKLLTTREDVRKRMGEAALKHSKIYHWPAIIPAYESLWRDQAEYIGVARLTEEAPQPGHQALLTPEMDAVFGHYPSLMMTDSTIIRRSAYAVQRAEMPFTPVIYEALKPLMSFRTMQAVLGVLDDEPMPIGDCIPRVMAATELGRQRVMLCIDFLIKHGYITVEVA